MITPGIEHRMRYAGIFALQAFLIEEVHKPIIKYTLDITQCGYARIIEVEECSLISIGELIGRKLFRVLYNSFF